MLLAPRRVAWHSAGACESPTCPASLGPSEEGSRAQLGEGAGRCVTRLLPFAQLFIIKETACPKVPFTPNLSGSSFSRK